MKFQNNKLFSFTIANAIIFSGFHGVGGPQTVHRPRYQPEIKDPLFKTIQSMGYEVVDSNAYTQTGKLTQLKYI